MQNTQAILNDCQRYLDKQAPIMVLDKIDEIEAVDLIVVIPSKGEDQLVMALESLQRADREGVSIQIIVIINCSISEENTAIDHLNRQGLDACHKMDKKYGSMFFRISSVSVVFEDRIAGVGLARKVGMDQAVKLFVGDHNPNGIIVNFDADCRCDPNYYKEIMHAFSPPAVDAVSIYFEHDLDLYPEYRKYIVAYECHLRYFRMAQRYTGHPFIHHTVGSSMAVRCSSYCRFGGMNKRKAGEDFYFLNKIAKYGRVEDLVSTRVIASSRDSDRVPFGTGRSMLLAQESKLLPDTYSFNSFLLLKKLFDEVKIKSKENKIDEAQVPKSLLGFLSQKDLSEALFEIENNTKDRAQFIRRFYQWFDPFKMMKACNYLKENVYPNTSVKSALKDLFIFTNRATYSLSTEEWLLKLREIEKSTFHRLF